MSAAQQKPEIEKRFEKWITIREIDGLYFATLEKIDSFLYELGYSEREARERLNENIEKLYVDLKGQKGSLAKRPLSWLEAFERIMSDTYEEI